MLIGELTPISRGNRHARNLDTVSSFCNSLIIIVTFADKLVRVTVNLNVITGCIPLIRPFLFKLQFSLINSSVALFPWVQVRGYGGYIGRERSGPLPPQRYNHDVF